MQRFSFIHLGLLVAGVAVLGGGVFLVRYHPAHGEAPEAAAPLTQPASPDAGAYLEHRGQGDIVRYVHPVYGFSFYYPKEFALSHASDADQDITSLRHPRLPLTLSVSVRSISQSTETLQFLTSLSSDYELEPPAGAQSNAVGWIAPDEPSPGQYTSHFWFAYQGNLYEVLASGHDLDPETLDWWSRTFIHDDLTLNGRTSDSHPSP
jgi:hypothetical protein